MIKTEKDGMSFFSVTSDNTTGPNWIERLEAKGFRVSKYLSEHLLSEEFKPTSDAKIDVFFLGRPIQEEARSRWYPNEIQAKKRQIAKSSRFVTARPESACLVLDALEPKILREMDLSVLLVMVRTYLPDDILRDIRPPVEYIHITQFSENIWDYETYDDKEVGYPEGVYGDYIPIRRLGSGKC